MTRKDSVYFYSDGSKIAADLYIPQNLTQPAPGIALCHGFAGVKELLLPAYAEKFAEKGFVTLCFDYRGFGESEGEPGRLVPKLQIEDIQAAIAYLISRPEVDNERIGLWGTSYGGANAIVAASENDSIKCLCVQLTFGDGERVITADMSTDELNKFKQTVTKMQQKKLATGKELMLPISRVLTDEQSKQFYQKYVTDFPALKQKIPFLTVAETMQHKPERYLKELKIPILFVGAEKDGVNPVSETRRLFELASEPKEILVIKGATHFELYSGDYFNETIQKEIEWFDKCLNNIISHSTLSTDMDRTLYQISSRIKQQGDMPYATVQYQLEILEQLSQFELGRFLLTNQGLDGYWTNYIITHPLRNLEINHTLSPLEDFILNKAPSVLATQQRFQLFLQENQTSVQENTKLASIPCGMMGELLYLDYSKISNFKLIGIDLDSNAITNAGLLAQQKGLSQHIILSQANAWNLNSVEEFDLISCNGLTLYEPDDNKVLKLYEIFYRALKPGGKLVTSFLTPPPSPESDTEWKLAELNKDDLMLQAVIFKYIINAKWQCYRSTQQTKKLLTSAGYKKLKFKNDDARIFPTVIGYK